MEDVLLFVNEYRHTRILQLSPTKVHDDPYSCIDVEWYIEPFTLIICQSTQDLYLDLDPDPDPDPDQDLGPDPDQDQDQDQDLDPDLGPDLDPDPDPDLGPDLELIFLL